MSPVDTENGVSVPDGTGKLVALHKNCFAGWLNTQIKIEPKSNLQIN